MLLEIYEFEIHRSENWCGLKEPGAQLFEGRLALNPGFILLCSKAFSWIIFSVTFNASNNQVVLKKN